MPSFRTPRLFNDHLLRLKADGSLTDPLRQFITDKEYAKYYVAGIVGWKYAMQTFAVLRSGEEVDRLVLNRVPCVIKPTHLSGPVLIYLGPETPIDRKVVKQWMRVNYYRVSRESNYRNLERKVIVEEYFSEDGRTVPRDYKIFCFHGCPKVIEVDSDRFRHHTRNLYDTAWNRLPIAIGYPPGLEDEPKPTHLEQMIEVARKLSKPFTSIRVDMYADESGVKVGELTNCHGGGTERIQPSAAESWLGSLFEKGVVRPYRPRLMELINGSENTSG